MAFGRRPPPLCLLLLVGVILLSSARPGRGFFFETSDTTTSPTTRDGSSDTSDEDSSDDSDDMDGQAAYGLEERTVVMDRCSASCSSAQQKLRFNPNVLYVYKYEGDLKTFITKSEYTGVRINAKANIMTSDGCEFVLKVTEATLEDYDPSQTGRYSISPSSAELGRALEAYTTTFAFDNGVIASVCPTTEDEPWVVNIKRAILSHVQHSMPTLEASGTVEETDISGVCQTTYERYPDFVKKTKDLNKCTDSHRGQSLLQGIEYRGKTGALPIMKITQQCKQSFDRDIISSSLCKEEFTFKPLKDKVSGASTSVVSRLSIVETTHPNIGDVYGFGRTRSSLLFDHTLSEAQMSESFNEAQETLRTLQQETSVTPSTPELFSKFAKQLKTFDYEKVQRIFASARNERAKSFVYDALPLMGTAAGVRFMRDLFSSVDLTRQTRWITSLAFIQEPTEDILAEAKQFLDLSYKDAALAVSSLVHNYLSRKGSNANSRVVSDVLNVFLHNLGPGCRVSHPDDEQRILTTLKAIGNTGHLDRVLPALKSCASNPDVLMAVRVAAVDAFRRQTCTTENIEFLETILNDQKIDSELRITSYLQRSKCFDLPFLIYIRSVLEREEINQVGSFIWTHLSNLAESQSPLKRDVIKLLKGVDTFKKFDLDERKFSRNMEWSYYNGRNNFGASAESNLIWSQDSFVPRSVNLNLTVDLFDRSVNLLEFGTRVQGIESMLEKLFAKKVQEGDTSFSDGTDVFDSKFQKKRDETTIGFYVRVFGNELVTEQLNSGLDMESIRERFNFLNWIMELAQERQVDFTRSLKILDSSLSLPTLLGLPLRLSVEGTATVTLQAKGKFDIRQLMSYPSNLVIGGYFNPSSAVVISGEMGIDSKLIKQGIKIANTLHTKMGIDGKIELKDGNSFSFDLNTPEQKSEYFSIESRFFVVHRGRNFEKVDETRQSYSNSLCLPNRAMGFDSCFEYSFNDLENVREYDVTSFTPAYLRLFTDKTDTHTGYHLSASAVASPEERKYALSFLVDTPRSSVDRKISLKFEMFSDTNRVNIQLHTPWKKLDLQSALQLTPQLWKAELELTIDQATRYEVKGEISNNSDQQKQQFEYKVEVTIPERPVVNIEGLLRKNDRRVEFQAKFENVLEQPLIINVNFNRNSRVGKYELTSSLSSQVAQLSLKCSVERRQPGTYSWYTKTIANYQLGRGQNQNAIIEFKINDQSSRNLKNLETDGSIELSEFPQYNGQAHFELEYSSTTLRSKLEFGPDEHRKISIQQSGILDLQGPTQKVNGKLHVEIPTKDVNWKAEYDHTYTDSQLISNSSIHVDGRKEFYTNIGYTNARDGPLNAAGNVDIGLPNGYAFKSSQVVRQEFGPIYHFTVDGQIITPRFVKAGRAEGSYKIADGARHEWELKVEGDGFKPVEISGHINPHPNNIELKGAIVYDGDSYGFKSKYAYNGDNRHFKYGVGAEVFYPGYEHGIEVVATKRMEEFSGSIAVLLRERAVYKMGVSLNVHPQTPSFSVKAEWPDNFFEISAFGQYMSEGWLTTTANSLHGQIALKSSLRSYEEMSGSFQLDHSDRTTARASIVFDPSHKIIATLLYEAPKITLDITTPFEGFSSIRFIADTIIQGRSLIHNSRVSWDREFVAVVVNGDLNSLPNLDCSLIINTAFPGLDSTSLRVKHLLSGSNRQASAELSLPRDGKITISYESNEIVNYDLISFDGRITLQTSFERLQHHYMAWNHKQNSTSMLSHQEVQIFDKKYELDLGGSSTHNRDQRVALCNLQVRTPHEGISDFGINLNYRQNSEGILSEGRLVANLEHKRITVEHSLQRLPGESLTFKLSATTPAEGYERLELDASLRFDGRKYHSANEIDLGALGRGTLGGSLEFDSRGLFDANFELTTSGRRLQRASLSFKNILENDDQWRTRAEFDCNNGDISISGETRVVLIGRDKKLELDISTTWEEMRVFKFASSAVGVPKNLKLSAEIEHNRLPEKIRTSFSYDVRDLRKQLILHYDLFTPWRSLKMLKSELKYNSQRQDNKYILLGFYELNHVRTSITTDVSFQSWEEFSTSTELLSAEQSIKLVTSVSYQPDSHLISATLTTPFSEVQKAELTIKKTGSWNSYASEKTFQLNEDRITLDTYYDVSQNNVLNFTQKLLTPYENIRSAYFTFKHVPKGSSLANGWSNEGYLELNGNRYTGHSEVAWPNRNELKVRAFVALPSEYGFKIHFKPDGDELDFKLDIKVDSKNINNHLNLKTPPGVFELQFTIQTQFEEFRNYEFKFRHEGTADKFITTASATKLGDFRAFSLFTEYDKETNKVKFDLRFETTIRGISVIQFKLDHNGPWNNFNTELTTIFGPLLYKHLLQFQIESPTNMILTISVDTPHSRFQNVALEMKHIKIGENFKSSAILTTSNEDYDRLSLEIITELGQNHRKFSGKVITWFSELPSMDVTLEAKVSHEYNNEASLLITIPAGQIIASIREDGDTTNIDLRTPFRNFEQFTVKLKETETFEEGRYTKETEIEITTPFAGLERTHMVTKVSTHENKMEIYRRVESSDPSIRFMEERLLVEHGTRAYDNVLGSLSINYLLTSGIANFDRLHFLMNYNSSESNNVEFTTSLETPFSPLREFKLEYMQRRSVIRLQASCNSYQQSFANTFIIDASNVLSISDEITTTVRGYERFLVKAEHRRLHHGFDNKFQIVTPFRIFSQLLVEFPLSLSPTDIHTGFVVEYTTDHTPNRISTNVKAVLRSIADHKIELEIISPFPILKEFSFIYGINLVGEDRFVTLKTSRNNEKKIEFEYRRRDEGNSRLALDLHSPFLMSSNVDFDGSRGTADFNWDTTRPDSNVKFEFSIKSEDIDDSVHRSGGILVITPDVRGGFEISYEDDSHSFSQSVGVYWKKTSVVPDFKYIVHGSNQLTREGSATEGSLRISGESLNHVVGFTHTTTRSHYVTVLYSHDQITNRRVSLNSDLASTADGRKHTIAFVHPDFPKDILSVIDLRFGARIVTWTHELRLNEEVFKLEASVGEKEGVRNSVESGIRFTHPSSQTDVQLNSLMHFHDAFTVIDGEILYMMSGSREMKSISLHSVYDRLQRGITIKIDTPVKSFELKFVGGEVDLDGGVLDCDVTISSEDLFQIKFVVGLDLPGRDLDLKLYTSESYYYQLHGRVEGISEGFLALSKFENSEDNAVKVGWSINARDFLVIKNFVRPQFWQQWRAEALQNLRQFSDRSRNVFYKWDALKQELDDDAAVKANAYQQAVRPYAIVFEEWGTSLRRNFGYFARDMERLYTENIFHIKDIVDNFAEFWMKVGSAIGRLCEKIASELRELEYKVQQGLEELGRQMTRLRLEMDARLEFVNRHFDAINQKITENLRDFGTRLAAFIHEMMSLREVSEFVGDTADILHTIRADIRGRFWMMMDNILSDRVVKATINYVASEIDSYKVFYGLIYRKERLADIVNGLRALTSDQFAKEKLEEAFEHFYKISENGWVIWQPQTGNFEYQFYFPPEYQGYADFYLRSDYQGITGVLGKILCKVFDVLSDWTDFVENIYSFNMEEFIDLLPPFKSTASLTGAQNFRTFDGRTFQFADDCTYLLTRDFVDKSFTALINYDNRLRRGLPVKKSISIITDGYKYDILPGGRIFVNEVRTELPFHHLNTFVVRVGDNEVQLISNKGFKLMCDIVHDHCALTVSGWYHGKLGGLFGTKDFEKANDLVNSDGVQVDSVEHMAPTWALPGQGQCSLTNKAVLNDHPIDSEAYAACKDSFNSTGSSLFPCFPSVDPADFFEMCMSEIPSGGPHGLVVKGVCRVAAAYRRECTSHDTYVRMPKPCVACEYEGSTHWEGDTYRIDLTAENKIADVVFVIQNGPCNKRVFDKIGQLADNLQKAFIENEGISSIAYALVGYGGKEGSPRLHTMEGHVFNGFDKIRGANFDVSTESTAFADGMAAIQFAAKLPFRAGSSKTIVFIPCHACNGTSETNYADLHRMILQSDIRFHALVPDNIRIKSSSPQTKSAFIFGFDDDSVYTKRDVNSELEGDASFRNFIRMPKDFCAALTHQTTGIVFSSKQWFDTPNQIQKSFVDVFARLVAKKGQPTLCQECSCLSDSVGSSITQCTSCLRRTSFSWFTDLLDEDFEETAEHPEHQGSPETHQRPTRPDFETRDPHQRHHSPRPDRPHRQHPPSPRPGRPTRAPRVQQESA